VAVLLFLFTVPEALTGLKDDNGQAQNGSLQTD